MSDRRAGRRAALFATGFLLLIPLKALPDTGLWPFGPLGFMLAYYALMAAIAAVALGPALLSLLTPPTLIRPLRIAVLALTGTTLFWALPLGYGLAGPGFVTPALAATDLLRAALLQILVVALAEELFFRELPLAIAARKRGLSAAIALPAFYALHADAGLAVALIASGAGLVYLGLRLAGVPFLLVVLIHGATNTLFSRILRLPLAPEDLPGYLATYLPGCIAIFALLTLISRPDAAATRPGRAV